MAKKQFKADSVFGEKGGPAFIMAALMAMTVLFVTIAAAQADTTRPTILSVSPMNNEQDASRNEKIVVTFSEDMDPASINADTITLMQRTTPDSGDFKTLSLDESVTYSNRVATLTPSELLSPDQEFGNVFTVTIATAVTDLAGHSISSDYIWSFTTGEDAFNTGATTSQLKQDSSPLAPAPAAPVPAPPIAAAPTPSPQATESVFPWAWVLGGLLVLLIILGILGFSRDSNSREKIPAASAIHDARPSPFGDVHPVMDIEGIGPVYKEGLLTMGIKNTKQLWDADPAKVARGIGAPLSSVKSWQHMAELASVKDIGPQYAELLERSGIHTIAQLKRSDPNKILKMVKKKQDSLDVNIVGNSPGHATVEHWISEARDHKFGGREEQAA